MEVTLGDGLYALQAPREAGLPTWRRVIAINETNGGARRKADPSSGWSRRRDDNIQGRPGCHC